MKLRLGRLLAELPPNTLVALVGDDYVRVKSEDIVYEAVSRWLRHEPAVRKAPDVLFRVMSEGVRLPLVSARCFGARVLPAPARAAAPAPVAIKKTQRGGVNTKSTLLGIIIIPFCKGPPLVSGGCPIP